MSARARLVPLLMCLLLALPAVRTGRAAAEADGRFVRHPEGADGEAVDTVAALDKAFEHAFSCDGPYVIDCRIDKDEFVLPMLPPGGSMDDIIMKVGE